VIKKEKIKVLKSCLSNVSDETQQNVEDEIDDLLALLDEK